MSMWWDADAKKYRSTLVHKVFYVWGWRVSRWTMFNCMSSERAHWFAVHVGLPLVYRIDRAWVWATTWFFWVPVVFVLAAMIRLLTMLPWFTCDPAASDRGE